MSYMFDKWLTQVVSIRNHTVSERRQERRHGRSVASRRHENLYDFPIDHRTHTDIPTDKADIVDGAPISIQVSARPCQDEECLAAASVIAEILLEGKPVNNRV
jgi:Asp-tRNA(Asn)/Glu-tRNA(Gln) amidotransferase A subunit family amidase